MALFNQNNFISAKFINNEKSDIEVLYQGANENVISHIVPVDTSQDDFVKLLEIVSIEQIEENTKEWIQSQSDAIFNFHKNLIESGKVQVQVPIESEDTFYIKLVKLLFEFDNTNEQHMEYLFRFKLELFDIEKIQNCSDEIKESIRQANKPIDLILLVKSVLES